MDGEEQRRSGSIAVHAVTLARSGVTLAVPATETVLEAAFAAGVALPFSCTVGGCMACKRKLLAGEVEMQAPHGLSAAARERGWILLCRARPRGLVVVDA
jgi:ferredoxin